MHIYLIAGAPPFKLVCELWSERSIVLDEILLPTLVHTKSEIRRRLAALEEESTYGAA